MKVKYVVVGAGLAGLTIAERIASQLNEKVLIIEKRPHIGGNVYDSYNNDGILIQNYGPHTFHTNDDEVFNYVLQFCEWHQYQHRVLSYVDGNWVPMPIGLETINKLYNMNLSETELMDFIESKKEKIYQIFPDEFHHHFLPVLLCQLQTQHEAVVYIHHEVSGHMPFVKMMNRPQILVLTHLLQVRLQK